MTILRINAFTALLAVIPSFGAKVPAPTAEPKITSIYPLSGQAGHSYEATVRGKNLKDARSLWFPASGISARVIGVESPDANNDLVRAEVAVEASAASGPHQFRVVTPAGISNQIELGVTGGAPAIQPAADTAINRFPVSIEGCIAKAGDVNVFPITIEAGQTLTLEAHSGFKGFDPSIAIAEQSGSWFDPQRVNRIAFNDEPLFFPGLSNDARLVHRFENGGKYLVQIGSFSGQGGPDYVYDLRITPGVTPPPILHPELGKAWEERQFTRVMASNWIAEVASRGSDEKDPKSAESFRAVKEGSANVPIMTPPGIVEGRIEKPGEAHVIQLRLEHAQDLVIELETPQATMPRFNPIVRLTESNGNEIVTNVYTKLNNNGLYMMKMIQPKTAFTMSAPGVYTLQIRDITTDRGGTDFVYRVLVRPQIPHVGKLTASADHLNLHVGETHTLTVTLDREEEFGGVVALEAEGLPAGVTAVAAMEKPADRPPLPNAGKVERYIPKPQVASLLLVTSLDAVPSNDPVLVRVIVRPVVKGKLGNPIRVGEIPVMVIGRRPS